MKKGIRLVTGGPDLRVREREREREKKSGT